MVQPNPDVPISDWSPIKERAILAFRGALKTTLTSGYCVQCVLCWPDIRILFVGGTLDKAAELIDMVRARFNHLVIEYLFPEFFPIPWAEKLSPLPHVKTQCCEMKRWRPRPCGPRTPVADAIC